MSLTDIRLEAEGIIDIVLDAGDKIDIGIEARDIIHIGLEAEDIINKEMVKYGRLFYKITKRFSLNT